MDFYSCESMNEKYKLMLEKEADRAVKENVEIEDIEDFLKKTETWNLFAYSREKKLSYFKKHYLDKQVDKGVCYITWFKSYIKLSMGIEEEALFFKKTMQHGKYALSDRVKLYEEYKENKKIARFISSTFAYEGDLMAGFLDNRP